MKFLRHIYYTCIFSVLQAHEMPGLSPRTVHQSAPVHQSTPVHQSAPVPTIAVSRLSAGQSLNTTTLIAESFTRGDIIVPTSGNFSLPNNGTTGTLSSSSSILMSTSDNNPQVHITFLPPPTPALSSLPSRPTEPHHRGLNGCAYELVGDMYGTGVRLGYYLQSISIIAATLFLPSGADFGRGSTAVLSLALTIIFVTAASSGSSLALEVPVFLAIATIISLPTLSQPFFIWPIRPSNVVGPGSYVVMVFAYIADMLFSVWAVVRGWYRDIPAECDILSGLDGESDLSKSAHPGWIALVSFGVILAGILLGMAIAVVVQFRRIIVPSAKQMWAATWGFGTIVERLMISLWTLISVVLVIVCILMVELTIRRHRIQTAALEGGEYGQWMAFVVGVATMIAVGWALISRRLGRAEDASSEKN